MINGRIIEPLESILAARDERAVLKQAIARKGYSCVSLSLNVPGYPKSNPVTKTFFELCLTDLKYHLASNLVVVVSEEVIVRCDAAGDYFLAPLAFPSGQPALVKHICELFEMTHPLGRFLDVDVNDQLGENITSGKYKACFFCHEKPAIECRRLGTHDPQQLRGYMFEQMASFCRQQTESQIAKKLSSFALQAILREISLTPKPGLVDKFSNGSHHDMSFQTFVDSSASISVRFEELVLAGFSFDNQDFSTALPLIRKIGLQMEGAMYEATGNVNTQKGIIFLMGLSLFAFGMLYARQERFDPDSFQNLIKNICKDLVRKELVKTIHPAKSHGEEIFLKYGLSGARGEAESGFQTVFDQAWPLLASATELDDTLLTRCFLAMASVSQDTNILFRKGIVVLEEFQRHCKIAFEDFNDENYREVIEYCSKERISPGGSADLLAVSIFIWSVAHAESLNANHKKGKNDL